MIRALKELGVARLEDMKGLEYDDLRAKKGLQVFTSVQIQRLLAAATEASRVKAIKLGETSTNLDTKAQPAKVEKAENRVPSPILEACNVANSAKHPGVHVKRTKVAVSEQNFLSDPEALRQDSGDTVKFSLSKTVKWSLAAAIVTASLSTIAVVILSSRGKGKNLGKD